MNSRHVSWPRQTLFALAVIVLPLGASAQIAVSITVAPPPLVVYDQPPIPEPGYIWTPGYWAYGPEGYFWVPGTWIEPPQVGLLWTPGYWAWSNGIYAWNAGYWAPQIGFYGGVDYGYGYSGHGYEGGYWRDNHFYYNRTVNNVTNVQVTNVYSKTVVNNTTTVTTSYVGGPGGINARPTSEEESVAHARHVQPTSAQTQQRTTAASRPELRAAVNHGHPAIAATAKPGDFSTHLASARGAESRPEENRPAAAEAPVHARDLRPPTPAAPAAAGASEEEKAASRQQTQLESRQAQERESLAQQQERDHARLSSGSGANNRQALDTMERQHQQQTQQLQQRHAQERQPTRPPAQKPERPEPERKPDPGH
jgi:WXXGXW repeat (2 copies)